MKFRTLSLAAVFWQLTSDKFETAVECSRVDAQHMVRYLAQKTNTTVGSVADEGE